MQIARGYSRDHRPDLNQVVLELIVERQAGIPLLMDPLNGNSSDKVSFRDTIKAHMGQLKTDVGLEYLGADSALYTAETLPLILATNQLDSQALPDDELLSAYKDQQKVERGFRFLKDPLFMASTLYLKSPKRIMALMRVMTLCLLVYAALEYRIRQALNQHDQTFPNQKGQPIRTPTARWVFQFFTGIHLLAIAQEQVLVLNMNEHQHRLLAVLGERYVALYSNSE